MDKIDIYVIDADLQMIGVVDAYKSLIWANRYRETGDFELYLKATTEALDLLRIGRYVVREDDDMVCRIRKIRLETSAEDGNYLTVTGTDAKAFLDQRIIWGTETVSGSVESFVRALVTGALIVPSLASRKLTNTQGAGIFSLGTAAGLTDTANEQISYANLGEKVRDYCLRFGWGYKVTWRPGGLIFNLYKGTDRTGSVIFSEEYENLAATAYEEDFESIANVALVAGVGEGEQRSKATVGFGAGVDRHEIFVDADDIAQEISFEDLEALFPSGSVTSSGSGHVYRVPTLDIELQDQNLAAWLTAEFPGGTTVTVSGVDYYRITNADVAEVLGAAPEPSDTVRLLPVIYASYLTTRGREKLAEFGAVTSFEGSVIPNVTFTYKEDYFLGDLVTVRNEYGITKEARIVEVVEVCDDNGYSIEPAFEYLANDDEETAPSGQTVSFVEGSPSMLEQKVAAGGGGGVSGITVTQDTPSGVLIFSES